MTKFCYQWIVFLFYLFREEAASSSASNTSNTDSTGNTSRTEEPFYLWTSLPNPLESDNTRTQRENEGSSTSRVRSSSSATAGFAAGQAAAVAARVASTAAARVASSATAMVEAAETQAADDSASNSSSASANATPGESASNSSQSSTNQSSRPVCRARYSRLPPSSSGPNQPSSFQFYRRRGNPPWASRIHDEMFEPSPNRVQSAEPDSAEQTPSSTSRCTPRQPTNQTDAPEARSPMSIRRQRRAAWEAGHASHWRRIEARRSNQDIIPPGAAHVAHIGRIPDTPPSTSTETGDASGGGSSSALETGGDTEMVTEVAESSRPTLLRAAPCPNVPPVASSSAGMC